MTFNSIHLRTRQAGDGPPVVILHGGPGLGHDYLFDGLSEQLADRYRLLFFDQRGSGRSGGREDPERLTMGQLVADLEELRGMWGLERMRLLGHSFGGLLALHYALEHPETTEALLLLDPDPPWYDGWRRFEEVARARETAEDRRQVAEVQARPGWEEDPSAQEELLRIRMRSYCASPEVAERLTFGLDADALANLQVTLPRVRGSLGRWDLRPRLGEVRCPVLLVQGAESIFPSEVAAELADGLPTVKRVWLEGVGHFPHLEAPKRWRRAARELLARLS